MEHKTYTCDRCGEPFGKNHYETTFVEPLESGIRLRVKVETQRYIMPVGEAGFRFEDAHFCPGCIMAIIAKDVLPKNG